MQSARAAKGSPLNEQAGTYIGNLLGGKYLDQGNPYLDSVYRNVESHVMPSIASVYTAGGRSPSGAGSFADTAARGLTEAFAPYAMQDYQAERGMQQQAAGMAPTLGNQDYVDAQMMGQVGAQREAKAQQYARRGRPALGLQRDAAVDEPPALSERRRQPAVHDEQDPAALLPAEHGLPGRRRPARARGDGRAVPAVRVR